eukprot:scaffold132408_cov27-Tisochrysis_lutea.AAC.2
MAVGGAVLTFGPSRIRYTHALATSVRAACCGRAGFREPWLGHRIILPTALHTHVYGDVDTPPDAREADLGACSTVRRTNLCLSCSLATSIWRAKLSARDAGSARGPVWDLGSSGGVSAAPFEAAAAPLVRPHMGVMSVATASPISSSRCCMARANWVSSASRRPFSSSSACRPCTRRSHTSSAAPILRSASSSTVLRPSSYSARAAASIARACSSLLRPYSASGSSSASRMVHRCSTATARRSAVPTSCCSAAISAAARASLARETARASDARRAAKRATDFAGLLIDRRALVNSAILTSPAAMAAVAAPDSACNAASWAWLRLS